MVDAAYDSEQSRFPGAIAADKAHIGLRRNGQANPGKNPLSWPMVSLVAFVNFVDNDHCVTSFSAK
jgi:hypothetical protein